MDKYYYFNRSNNSNIITRRLCRNRSRIDDNELYRSNSFKFERFKRKDVAGENATNTMPRPVSQQFIIWQKLALCDSNTYCQLSTFKLILLFVFSETYANRSFIANLIEN